MPGIQQIATGFNHTCALVTGGEVRCWGGNGSGRLGDGTTIQRLMPVAVSGLMGVTAIAAGSNHTCALVAGGEVRCWGGNGSGQLGDGTNIQRLTPVAVSGLMGATAIVAGSDHTCALVAGGEVRCWGFNSNGQVGDGTTSQRLTPVPVSGLTGATAIAAGGSHTCALMLGGEALCWGGNGSGQLGDGTTTQRPTPVAVSGLSGVSAIVAGSFHTCALVAGGHGRCWGINTSGQLGDDTTTNQLTPVPVSGLSGATAIAAGNSNTCALVARGEVRCWGGNGQGQLGDGTTTQRLTPVAVSGLSGGTAIAAGNNHTCALVPSGEGRCWGYNADGRLGDGTTTQQLTPTAVTGLTGSTAIAADNSHTCAVVAGGQVRCWGANNFGQLGDGTTTQRLTPMAVSGLSGVTAIVAGSAHTCALVTGGEVRCWGVNGQGQLGDGTTTQRLTPVAVSGLFGVTAIAAGSNHTCALVTGGDVRCWGSNTLGALGDGTTAQRLTPVAVSGLTGATAIAADNSHTCTLVPSGEGRCWGYNADGQLGDGTITQRLTPVPVSGLTGATAIATGRLHSCALVAGGDVRCWGSNDQGRLGDGTTTQRLTPVAVSGLSGVTAISAGSSHTCTLITGGEVRCWGSNSSSGQLGDGTTTNRQTPVAVSGLAGATAIVAGSSHSCALVAGGEVRCWGFNGNGQLGDGTLLGIRPFPAPVLTPQALPNLGINDVTAPEGNAGTTNFTFTVSLSAPAGAGGVTFDIATATGTAIAPSDYVARTLSSQTIPFGQSSYTFTVSVNGDALNETNEAFFVNVTNVSGAAVLDGQGVGTITNDDPLPSLSINDVSVIEGNSGTVNAVFTLSLSVASGQTTGVSYITANGTATQPGDYTSTSGSVTFTPGQTSQNLSVPVVGETSIEPNETFFLNLSGATDATISDNQGIGTITDDDGVPPGAPTIGTATAGDAHATVTFTAPVFTGSSAITGFAVTSNPGGLTGTGASSPITVTGLTNGTTYTFTVTATNSSGTGLPSAASNSVTPSASAPAPVLRPDRVILRENSGAVEISVLANDSIASAFANVGVLSITTVPTRGTASVLTRGTSNVLDDAIRYTPSANTSGVDTLVYRVCFGRAAPCAEAPLAVDVRPLALAALEFSTTSDRGYRDETLSGLRALPTARFEAHGFVPPSVEQVFLNTATSANTPWGAGASTTVLRSLVAGTASRDWRVLVDARTNSGGDLDLYLGIDSNNNGQADASELACSAAMGADAERCDLALAAPANGNVRYWVLLHAGSPGQAARLELFETPLDVPAANRSLVATGPGSLAANATFDVRLSWNDPTFLPGQSRGGWVHVRAEDNTSVGWVPVRIDRSAGDAMAYALQSGVDYTLALAPNTAHERLYIDVPPGAARLDVTTASSSNIDLYLARVDAPVASGATPTIAPAPARNLASSSAITPSGNESLSVTNPVAGRWYVTPVNASGATADVVIRATLTGTGPQLRSGGFFNPSRSGNGLFVYPAGSDWAGLWYTYLQDGSSTWYYMQGAAPGANGIWRGSIFRSAWNGSSNRLTVVGQATITPTTTGAFTFNYSVDGETGSEAYSNFSGACPTVSGTPLDISGHWFDPLRSGSGYSVQSFPDYEFYLVFGYDAQGVPRYLVAERSGFGGSTETLTLEQLRGVCPLCTRTGNPQRTNVGTLQRRIEGGTLRNITLSATYVNGVPGTWAANDAVIPLGNLRGCAL